MCDGGPLEPYDELTLTDGEAIDLVFKNGPGYVVRSAESGDYFEVGDLKKKLEKWG